MPPTGQLLTIGNKEKGRRVCRRALARASGNPAAPVSRNSMCLTDSLGSSDEQLLVIDAVSLDAQSQRFKVSQLGKADDLLALHLDLRVLGRIKETLVGGNARLKSEFREHFDAKPRPVLPGVYRR